MIEIEDVDDDDEATDASAAGDGEGASEAPGGVVAVEGEGGGEDGVPPETATHEADGEAGVGTGAEADGEGGAEVSVGKVMRDVPCDQDDPDFLYKDRPGLDCPGLAANHPDKCSKLHNGAAVGATSCPKSCDMMKECLLLKQGGDDAGEEIMLEEAVGEEDVVITELVSLDGNVTEVIKDYGGGGGEDDAAPVELEGEAVLVIDVPCEDDPDFLYKDKEGLTCAYIGEYKPDKCLKLHGGETVGAASCPRSCGMVEECERLYKVTGTVVVDGGAPAAGGVGASADAVVGDVEGADKVAAEVVTQGGEDDGDAGEGAEGATPGGEDGVVGTYELPDAAAEVGGEVGTARPSSTDALGSDAEAEGDGQGADGGDADPEGSMPDGAVPDGSEPVGLVPEGSEPTETGSSAAGPVSPAGEEGGPASNGWSADSADPGSGSGLDANGWSADSADVAPPPPPCVDDPDFLYKDRPGFDCTYLASESPEKCHKLHNGKEIGVDSCPESCGMVDKCLGGGKAATELGPSGVLGGGEGAADAPSAPLPHGSVGGEEGADADADDGLQALGAGGEVEEQGEVGISGGAPAASYGGTYETPPGTKSMAEEIDKVGWGDGANSMAFV